MRLLHRIVMQEFSHYQSVGQLPTFTVYEVVGNFETGNFEAGYLDTCGLVRQTSSDVDDGQLLRCVAEHVIVAIAANTNVKSIFFIVLLLLSLCLLYYSFSASAINICL